MSEFEELRKKLVQFREERNWKQFHNPKDLAMALSIEASELNELFLWKTSKEEWTKINRERLSEELADVLAYALLLADYYDFDIKKILMDKIRKNGLKYPVEKSYNSSQKYNEREED